MKKAALLLLCFVCAVSFCSCSQPTDISGDTVYRLTSDTAVSEPPKDWEHAASSGDIKMFIITNSTDLSFDEVEIKPFGYNGWESIPYDFISGGQFSYPFARGDIQRYKKWDFRMKINFDLYYTVTAIDINDGNIILNGTIENQTYETAVSN